MENKEIASNQSSILIVDDTPANIRVLGDILEREGFELRVTTSGKEALNLCRYNPPDLVLLDVMMPELDGFTVCRKLQQDPQTRKIPVIFISALESQQDKIQGFQAGGVDYVTKPFQAEEVLARVRTHLKLVKAEALSREVEERKAAQEQLEKALEQKNVLIRELYHRTRNTIQLVRSLMALKAGEMPENVGAQDLVTAMEQRIDAISLVHQMLYESMDLSYLSLREYASRLCKALLVSQREASGRIGFTLQGDEGSLLLDTAVPLGLIVTELMVNSLLWAFPGGRKGSISLEFRNEGSEWTMVYQDDGIGLPPGFDLARQKTLGLTLVRKLAENQMKGKITLSGDGGTRVEFRFNTGLYGARV